MWSYQALLILIIYILVALLLSGVIIISPGGNSNLAVGVFAAILMMGLFTSFDTNCTVEGDCKIFGGIKTILYCITPVVLIIFAIYLYHNPDFQIGPSSTTQSVSPIV